MFVSTDGFLIIRLISRSGHLTHSESDLRLVIVLTSIAGYFV